MISALGSIVIGLMLVIVVLVCIGVIVGLCFGAHFLVTEYVQDMAETRDQLAKKKREEEQSFLDLIRQERQGQA